MILEKLEGVVISKKIIPRLNRTIYQIGPKTLGRSKRRIPLHHNPDLPDLKIGQALELIVLSKSQGNRRPFLPELLFGVRLLDEENTVYLDLSESYPVDAYKLFGFSMIAAARRLLHPNPVYS